MNPTDNKPTTGEQPIRDLVHGEIVQKGDRRKSETTGLWILASSNHWGKPIVRGQFRRPISTTGAGEKEKPQRCCAQVGSVWHPHNCGTKATVQYCGKWFCKRHDPAAVAERRAKTDALYNGKWKMRKAEIHASEMFTPLLEGLKEARRLMSDTLHSIAASIYEDEKKANESVKSNIHIQRLDALIARAEKGE